MIACANRLLHLEPDAPKTVARQSLNVTDLRRDLERCSLARHVEWHESVGSTNDEARRLGRAGGQHGALVVAEEQTRGRGRRQRRWDSPAGGGIYLSVLLRPPPEAEQEYAAGVQLAAGIAVLETIAPLLPNPVELVWPNDVFSVGLKLAGVLVEGETMGRGLDLLVCGIGLNVNQAREDFDAALGGVGGSLRMLSGRPQDRHALLVRLLFNLESWERVARAGDGHALAERFVSLSPTSVGCRTQVRTAEGLVEGQSAGVTAQGALILETPEGVREIFVGELERAWRKQ